MSWNLSYNAPDKAAALAELEKQAVAHGRHLPEPVKASIASAIEALPECSDSNITVSSYGHFHAEEHGHRGTSNMALTVQNHFNPVDPAPEAA